MKPEEVEADKEFYNKIMARTLVKRGGAYVWVSSFENAVADFQAVINNSEYAKILGDMEVARIHKDIAAIQNRNQSLEVKKEGDNFFYRS